MKFGHKIEDDFSIELETPEPTVGKYVAVKKVSASNAGIRLMPGDIVPPELAELKATMDWLLQKGAIELKE
jgi:hypothetical protein